MHFLANENMLGSAVRELRTLGHDVLWAKESFAGADDTTVLQIAMTQGRILLTQDKDFGELAYRAGLPVTCGVIFFRLSGTNPIADAKRIVEVVQSRMDWTGNFTTASQGRIRIRPLPTTF